MGGSMESVRTMQEAGCCFAYEWVQEARMSTGKEAGTMAVRMRSFCIPLDIVNNLTGKIRVRLLFFEGELFEAQGDAGVLQGSSSQKKKLSSTFPTQPLGPLPQPE